MNQKTARVINVPRRAGLTALIGAVLSTAAIADDALATVNGAAITRAHLDAYKVGRTSATTTDKTLLDEMVNLELMAQEAKAKGFAERPAIAAEIENQRRSTLANALVRQLLTDQPVTDEEVKEAYRKRLDELPKQDYRLSNLVTDDELLADTLRAEMAKGAKFEDLKTRPGVKPNSAKLNWMSPDQMPPPIATAVKDLKKGEVAAAPVRTPAGWHVLAVDEIRPYTPPTLEAVKDQIKPILENNRITLHIQAAKEKANINVSLP